MRSKKLQHAIEAMPSQDPMVLDLLRRYAKSIAQAARLEREASKEPETRLRVALLREARGQTQTAMVCLREASEHAHRGARMGSHVGHDVPSWLTRKEDIEAGGEH